MIDSAMMMNASRNSELIIHYKIVLKFLPFFSMNPYAYICLCLYSIQHIKLKSHKSK